MVISKGQAQNAQNYQVPPVGGNNAQAGAVAATEAKADTWECPQCHNTVSGKFCPECGTKRPEAPAKKFCTNCGKEVKDGAKFCPECGTKIEG